jgi:hypothetical protein
MLLLDVDGVISLFGFDHRCPPPGRYALVDGIMHFLSATAAAQIAELTEIFELVWCTGWEEKADEHLPAQLGLPPGLAHLTFATADPGAAPRHWKLAAIDAFAGPQRPLAWIDDAHDDSCRQWAADRAGPTLLVVTEPAIGITDAHVRALGVWAASLAS